ALGSKFKGEYVGKFGDAAIYSFGRDKCLSSVFGGLAVTARTPLALQLEQKALEFGHPNKLWVLQQLMHPLILSLSKKLWNFYSLGKVILAAAARLQIISKAVYPQEKLGDKPPFGFKKMPNALASLALNQFHKSATVINHRRKILATYKKNLPANLFIKERPQSEPVYLRVPIQLTNAKEVLLEAKKQGIELGDWYGQAIAPSGVEYTKIHFQPENCPVAASLTKNIINLPTSIQINDLRADQIIDLLKPL
ncbi:MAG: DegT/DnrJ/EryC1/StrS family aminotransferase, partial [Candidatus Magasanikbacteria bacterium]|nr:DegT/DnrJ/EryC1/StrS family aminotransferase [Candidatus Magasanikbacteria bacterium]